LNENELFVTPYNRSAVSLVGHVFAGIVGYALGFVVFWVFYQAFFFSLVASGIFVPVAIGINIVASKKRRLNRLLGQFQSLLESLVVSLQAGSPDLKAFNNALDDMILMYSDSADIVKEVKLMMAKFANRTSIGEALMDFAERSGLEDIRLFASVYIAVEGKGEKTSEIVIRSQKILSDKITIQSEIRTMASGAVMEINIMLVIPVVIVAVMGSVGGEMMASLFTPLGHIVATVALVIFALAYIIGKKMVNIKV
jgi:tight adherence protein B